MSNENMEIVRQILELFRNRDSTSQSGFGEHDIVAATKLFHPDFVLDTTRTPMPDLRGKYSGLTEVMAFWRSWLEAWGSIEFEYELTDAGDHVFAAMTVQSMRGKASGVEVDFPPYWQVFTVRERRCIRQALFPDLADALEAAGLPE